jgi:short-subunit dehydrogenase
MVARGQGGHIVNIASAAAFTPSVTLPAYATTKVAVRMLSECLRAELAGEGIGVSAICPGLIDTPITTRTTFMGVSADEQDRRRKASAELYKWRGLGPEVVAEAIVRAVEQDLAVVPVSIEAHALDLLGRFAPSLARSFAKVDFTAR